MVYGFFVHSNVHLYFTICHIKNKDELSRGYQLNFIGKDYARRQAGEMPTTVIVPDKEQNDGEGKNSKNLFFTGDNLEVLRHLQKAYASKIDVVYIDIITLKLIQINRLEMACY